MWSWLILPRRWPREVTNTSLEAGGMVLPTVQYRYKAARPNLPASPAYYVVIELFEVFSF
jgi:hypothetical protein